jgi:CBS domain-containing protein
MAYHGLDRMKVAKEDAERYLKIIENRIHSQNGAEWMVQTYRELRKSHNPPVALRQLTACLFNRSFKGYPVDAWKSACRSELSYKPKKLRVGDRMSTRVFTAQEEDSAALVVHMMKWKGIHHVPVLNGANELTGLISWSDVIPIAEHPEIYHTGIRQLMKSELITINRESSLAEAKSLMREYRINCLPVIEGHTLVGILTSNDL